jgi:Spy/CpxP family protein refolding chaperone
LVQFSRKKDLVMALFKVLPGLMMSACLAAVIAPSSLAQARGVETTAEQPSLPLVQASDGQPATAADLEVDDLTDEQVAQLEAIFDAYEPQIEEATASYMAALENMNNLLVPSTSDAALTNGYNDLALAQQTKDNLIFQRNLALRGVLTLDQRQAINDYVRTYLGIAPPEPVAEFPKTLVGSDADTTLANLQAEGWAIAFTTPSQVGLNRGSERLDLSLNRSGQISAAQLF